MLAGLCSRRSPGPGKMAALVKDVRLRRSETCGFGFSILGGAGSELPPIIYDIIEGSPAANSCQVVRAAGRRGRGGRAESFLFRAYFISQVHVLAGRRQCCTPHAAWGEEVPSPGPGPGDGEGVRVWGGWTLAVGGSCSGAGGRALGVGGRP